MWLSLAGFSEGAVPPAPASSGQARALGQRPPESSAPDRAVPVAAGRCGLATFSLASGLAAAPSSLPATVTRQRVRGPGGGPGAPDTGCA